MDAHLYRLNQMSASAAAYSNHQQQQQRFNSNQRSHYSNRQQTSDHHLQQQQQQQRHQRQLQQQQQQQQQHHNQQTAAGPSSAGSSATGSDADEHLQNLSSLSSSTTKTNSSQAAILQSSKGANNFKAATGGGGGSKADMQRMRQAGANQVGPVLHSLGGGHHRQMALASAAANPSVAAMGGGGGAKGSKLLSSHHAPPNQTHGGGGSDNLTTSSSSDQTLDDLHQLARNYRHHHHAHSHHLHSHAGPCSASGCGSEPGASGLGGGGGGGGRFLLGVLFTLAELLLFATVLLWLYWAYQHDDGLAWQSDRKQQFNTHAALMLTGFVFLSGQAMLIHRAFQCCSRIYTKILHTILFVLATSAISLGLILAYTAQENVGPNNKPIMHFYSLHAWLGLATVALFALQFAFGFVTFLVLLCCEQATARFRAALLPIHKTFGLTIFSLALSTSLTGLLQTARSRLSAKLNKTDYHEMGESSIIINLVGVCLICLAILMPYIIRNLDLKRPFRSELDRHLKLSQLEMRI